MEFPDMNPTGRSPRRELQGPRPTPLRINKDSHKIKKPPLAPPPQQPPSHHQAPPPPRQPIIIYTVSPKIIHTTPGDFMSLVQRLTGSSASSSSSTNNNAYPSSSTSLSAFPASASTSDVAVVPNNDPFNVVPVEMVSPAARYAAIEKARSPVGKNKIMIHQNQAIMNNGGNQIITTNNNNNSEVVEGLEMMMMGSHGVVTTTTNNMFQAGILSPGPASLSPIPSSFFSPLPSSSSDPSMVSFFHDLSPMLHNSASAFVMPSPSNFVSPQTPTIDLFNYFLD